MGKICVHCGKECRSFWEDSLYLTDDIVMCQKCAGPIAKELSYLFNAKDNHETAKLVNSILTKSESLYNSDVTDYIITLINKRINYRRLVLVKQAESENNRYKLENLPATSSTVPHAGATDNSSVNDSILFNNIGEKICSFAESIAWIGIAMSIVIGIVLIVLAFGSTSYYSSNSEPIFYIIIGLIVAIVGSLASWISSFILYGFGHLVKNSDIIVKELKNLSK